jgi:hypothetical protein
MSNYEMLGIISKNKYKKMPSQPDITGKATIEGKEIKIAGWAKVGKDGPYYSIKFTFADDVPKEKTSNSFENDIDDEIPFK